MDASAQSLFIVLFIAILLICLLPVILCLITLQKTLTKCSMASRTMAPEFVWLVLIPLFGIYWQFKVVFAMAQSLRNEFKRRNLTISEENPGESIGLWMCICTCCTIIPKVGSIAGLIGFVLWLVYWMKMSAYAKVLDDTWQAAPESPFV